MGRNLLQIGNGVQIIFFGKTPPDGNRIGILIWGLGSKRFKEGCL